MSSNAAEPDFDVIVVGAGIAGSVTAHQLAAAGRSVVLIERGEFAGSKNLSGGVLYSRVLEKVFPDLLERAPIERRITRNCIEFLSGSAAVCVDYQDARLGDPVNAVTVLRARLDPWLAEQCEQQGALLMPGVRVDRLFREDGRVAGVEADGEVLRSRVVVAADGVNSFLAREAGLRAKPPTNQLAVGVKAVVSLGEEVLAERFQLTGDDGTAYAIVGDCTQSVGGGGFLYTNRDSVSVGVVLRLDDLVAKGLDSAAVFEHFTRHPVVAKLLAGGELLEYGSHLVAEGGLNMLGEIASDGLVVVGDAAGLTLNTGLTVRGMDLAAGSGIAAAGAIDAALGTGDVSASGLAGYRQALMESFVGQDLQTYSKAPAFLERGRMYQGYPDLLADIMYAVFNHDLRPRQHLRDVARQQLQGSSPVRLRDLVSDGFAGVRAL